MDATDQLYAQQTVAEHLLFESKAQWNETMPLGKSTSFRHPARSAVSGTGTSTNLVFANAASRFSASWRRCFAMRWVPFGAERLSVIFRG
jgi:hypothetical protein